MCALRRQQAAQVCPRLRPVPEENRAARWRPRPGLRIEPRKDKQRGQDSRNRGGSQERRGRARQVQEDTGEALMAKNMLDAALQFAKDGYEILPAPPNEKKSYKSAGKSNGHRWGSTLDPDTIRLDWKRWPQANIGLPTGAINGIWVLEIDTVEGHGVDGVGSLLQVEQRHGKLPRTLVAVSPSGSRHYYFKVPEGRTVKTTSSELGPGIDVRGEGGMVIAPPSAREGRGAYRWRN